VRLAIAGKGGAGKTTISATVARLSAKRGQQVVAIDADANPNLAVALGLSPGDAAGLGPVPFELVSRRLGGAALTESLDEVLSRFALGGPDGVRLVGMGAPTHAGEGCLCSAHAVVSAVLEDLGGRPDMLGVIDMEASPEHLSRGTIKHADVLGLVAEPYYRSLETVRRMAALAAQLSIPSVAVIANKVRSEADGEAVAEFCSRHGLAMVGVVPWSDDVLAADRARIPLVDWGGAGDVVEAISAVCSRLELPGFRDAGSVVTVTNRAAGPSSQGQP